MDADLNSPSHTIIIISTVSMLVFEPINHHVVVMSLAHSINCQNCGSLICVPGDGGWDFAFALLWIRKGGRPTGDLSGGPSPQQGGVFCE